jgi:UDP-N-acetyl-D-mannosaminuronic acid dehydrogenase
MIANDRIVGGISEKSTKEISDFYKTFIRGRVFQTNSETAEMCKLAENSFRDINIAFANEIDMLCNDFKIDSRELISLANKHPRVSILEPGIGVGGHCIAVDPHFLISRKPENSQLINMARQVNRKQTDKIIVDIKRRIKIIKNIKNKNLKITLLGLTYKPDIGDLRESPAMQIFNELDKSEDIIMAVDPHITDNDNLLIFKLEEAVSTSDLVVCLVKHSFFMQKKNMNLIRKSNYVDYCNLISNKK